jgi:DNA polymerase-3 subunit gamma/tau
MLSISAFNALLKIIEEPPEHLLFILATTELHKVPATILSRCQRFSFRRISQEDIAARLQFVAYQESIDLDESAARVLARMADGAMRDGLSLLDQCASATEGELTAEKVYACLGIAGEQKCGELMGYIAQHNTRAALELFNRLYADGKDITALLDELACLTRDLLILKTAPGAGVSMLSGVAPDAETGKLADQFSTGELVRIMEQLEQTMSGFTRSASRRMDAELCLISLCQPELQVDASSLNARLTRLEDQIKTGAISFIPAEKEAVATVAPVETEERLEQTEKPISEPEQVLSVEPVSMSFWTDLVAAVRQELKPPVSGFFTTSANAPVQGEVQGNRIILKCANNFTLEMIDKPEVLSLVGRKASVILGRPVSAAAVDRSARPETSPSMERLMRFGEAHRDIVTIKDN